jgi:hypothetical protein
VLSSVHPGTCRRSRCEARRSTGGRTSSASGRCSTRCSQGAGPSLGTRRWMRGMPSSMTSPRRCRPRCRSRSSSATAWRRTRRSAFSQRGTWLSTSRCCAAPPPRCRQRACRAADGAGGGGSVCPSWRSAFSGRPSMRVRPFAQSSRRSDSSPFALAVFFPPGSRRADAPCTSPHRGTGSRRGSTRRRRAVRTTTPWVSTMRSSSRCRPPASWR